MWVLFKQFVPLVLILFREENVCSHRLHIVENGNNNSKLLGKLENNSKVQFRVATQWLKIFDLKF